MTFELELYGVPEGALLVDAGARVEVLVAAVPDEHGLDAAEVLGRTEAPPWA